MSCDFITRPSFGSLNLNVWGQGRRWSTPHLISDWSPDYMTAGDKTCVLCMYATMANDGFNSDYAEVEFRITKTGGSPVTSYVLNLPAGTNNEISQQFVVPDVDKLLVDDDLIELWVNQIFPETFIDAFVTMVHFTPP